MQSVQVKNFDLNLTSTQHKKTLKNHFCPKNKCTDKILQEVQFISTGLFNLFSRISYSPNGSLKND